MQTKFLYVLGIMLLTFSACQKEEDNTPSEEVVEENYQEDAYLTQGAVAEVLAISSNETESLENGRQAGNLLCSEVVKDEENKIITIAFDSTCTAQDGVIRSGSFIISYTGSIQTDDFRIDSIKVNNYVVNNTFALNCVIVIGDYFVNEKDQTGFHYSIQDGVLEGSSEQYVQFDIDQTYTSIDNHSFELTGTKDFDISSEFYGYDQTLHTSIEQPLLYEYGCLIVANNPYPSDGTEIWNGSFLTQIFLRDVYSCEIDWSYNDEDAGACNYYCNTIGYDEQGEVVVQYLYQP